MKLSKEDLEEKRLKIIEETKKIIDSGTIEIGENSYAIQKMDFRKARKVYTYFTSIQMNLTVGNYLFMETPEFSEVEKLICQYIDFNKSSINAIGIDKHFNEHRNDYDPLMTTCMTVFSYDFIPGVAGQ